MDTASNSSSGPSAAGCRCARSSARASTCRRPTVPRSSAGTRRCSSAACSAPTRVCSTTSTGRRPSGCVTRIWRAARLMARVCGASCCSRRGCGGRSRHERHRGRLPARRRRRGGRRARRDVGGARAPRHRRRRRVDASIGLAHRLLATTRASLAVRHPATDTSGAVRLVWDGRLDNRDELEAGADESDEAVVLRGYARWGDELPARLLGDFALALWDAPRRRLLCARDRLGLKPFHYVWRQGVFRFASEAEPLLRALDGPEPDDEMVLALLLREFRPGDEDRTLVRDVHRLPPGHALIVDGDGLRCFRYWALDPTRTLTLGSDAEYVERVRAVFREAVAARLRTDWPVGALLSGGLDSSAIVCAAGRTWEERGEGSPPLQTFTLFADHPAGDEREPARVVTEATGLKGHAVRRLDADPLDGLDAEVDAAGGPIVDPSHHTMAGCLDAIGAAGCRVVLSGEGGDQLLDEPGYLADLLRTGRLLGFAREVRAFARSYGASAREVGLDAAAMLAPTAA